MKTFWQTLVVCSVVVLGFLVFGGGKVSAAAGCDVLASNVSQSPLGPNDPQQCLMVYSANNALSGVSNIPTFISKIKYWAKYGDIRQRYGAAYIAKALTGGDPKGWEDRLSKPDVTLKITSYTTCTNTKFIPYAPGGATPGYITGYTDCGTFTAAEFIVGKTIYYAIKTDCGNPLGGLPGLPPYSGGWSLTGATSRNKTSTPIGGSVTFTSSITNHGPDTTSTFAYGPRYFYSNTASPVRGSNGAYPGESAGGIFNKFTSLADGKSVTSITQTISPVAAGFSYICGTVAFSPYNSNGDPNGRSAAVCVSISIPPPACVYDLTVTPNSLEPSTSFTVSASVSAANATVAASIAKNDSFYINVTGPEGDPTFSSLNPSVPMSVSGTTITGTTGNIGPTNAVGNFDVAWGVTGTAGQIDCGSTATAAGCSGDCGPGTTFPVANHPYFSVIGGDIAAGAGFTSGTTACTQDYTAGITAWNNDNTTQPNYNGAGSQLAAFALGNIESFVSGQSQGLSPDSYALSFANSGVNPPPDGKGNYGGQFASTPDGLPCLPDYANMVTSTTVWPGSYATSGSYVYPSATGTGNLTLGGTPPGGIPHDTVINLKVNGDVYITGNITYDDSKGPGHYPRFNLIATGSIYIAPNVTELHGLYVAEGGSFVGCATGVGAPADDYNTCANQLTVYGAVSSAQKLTLNRMFGDVAANDGPAETFVYSPELWLATPECTAIPSDPNCGAGAGVNEWDAVSSLPPTL